ncbi:hypothetical protein C8J57DRAFT_1270108 [Mycena rebaudengoi]|nr:hypothetical protein C8J57DRAFT_1270108 [Mycena rebaudengoi]
MLSNQQPLTQNHFLSNKSVDSTPKPQHGLHIPDESLSKPQHGLLHIPAESLSYITSNLDPRSLLSLAQVSTLFSDHVKDEHTWHRAFLHQLLGVGPETELHGAKLLLLRRAHLGSWRQEFILHFSFRRRWERSRNPTIAHVPLHSPVSSMHLMPSLGLVSSSLQYGVVSRSLPFTGRILRGYLDASGTGTGLGIGNPNTEFNPNVSACALASDGGTVKVLWGFRNGSVAFTCANKAMDASSRSAAKFTRCTVGDEHQGMVTDVLWDGGNNAVTGGGDGRVKLWDAKKARCLWTSEDRGTDECIMVAGSLGKGLVAGAMRSGDICVWIGFTADMVESPASINVLTIPSPIHGDDTNPTVSGLFIDDCRSSPTLLVTFLDHAFFYRFELDVSTSTVETTKFGDPALGPITSLKPFFTNESDEYSLVITGTQLGCVGIYDWTSSSPLPTRVTALAWNGLTLVTGCARGTTKVWDALTLEHLRTFPTPASGPLEKPEVTQILLGSEKDTLLVAWRAGPVPKGGGLKSRHVSGRKKERSAASKYHQQLEMHQAIVESRLLLEEENKSVQKAYGREKEHRAQLETLGLDESEAIEYIMMLSLEEAAERQRNTPPAREEGVFQGDFDFDDVSDTPRSSSPSSQSSGGSSPPRPSTSTLASSSANRDIPLTPAHFPPISANASPRSSPGKSAWSSPLAKSPVPSPGSSASHSRAWGGISGRAPGTSVSPPSSLVFHASRNASKDDMDADLRFAIELSLAEARSRV